VLASLLAPAAPAAAGPWSRIQDALDELGSRETLSIVAGGAALSYVASTVEDPDGASDFFSRGHFGSGPAIGNTYGENATIGLGLAGLWMGGAITGRDRWSSAAEDGLLAALLASSVSTTLKVAFDRTRPDGGPHAFPSGHTTIAAALAPVLDHHFGGWVGFAAYTLPAFTAAGRVHERRHFPSDVIFGYAVGLAAGRAVAHGESNDVRVGVTPTMAYARFTFF
jgi:hypothetical protein